MSNKRSSPAFGFTLYAVFAYQSASAKLRRFVINERDNSTTYMYTCQVLIEISLKVYIANTDYQGVTNESSLKNTIGKNSVIVDKWR